MKERIIIKNFAGIKSLDLDIGKINILIGPQATGKSVTAKLLYFFKTFLSRSITSIRHTKNQQVPEAFDSIQLRRFEEYFPSESLSEGSFSIKYEINDDFIKIENKRSNPKIEFSNGYLNIIETYRKNLINPIRKAIDRSSWSSYKANDRSNWSYYRGAFESERNFLGNIETKLGALALYEQLFVPAGRSIFALIRSGIFHIIREKMPLDPFLIEFGSLYESIKEIGSPILKNKELNKRIEYLVKTIICGEYQQNQGEDFIVSLDGRKTNLANSSSGQQEILPLALILRSLATVEFSEYGQSIYIEEPEAHLFPTAQRNIVELIAAVFNSSKLPLQFIITTHSPYILTAFNNLLQAGVIEKKLPAKKRNQLHKIVPSYQILKTGDVKAYSLSDGTGHSIISEETGLISADVIDEVSDELSIQFGNLLEFE